MIPFDAAALLPSNTIPFNAAVPLYMTPPSTPRIRHQIRAGRLGAIATPRQGNRLHEGWWWCADNGVFTGAYPGDEEFLVWLRSLRHLAPWCLFAVAPDVVGNHFATWNRSYDMLQRIRDLGFPAAFVGQNIWSPAFGGSGKISTFFSSAAPLRGSCHQQQRISPAVPARSACTFIWAG
ncbi:hypothetical protein OG339_47900 (plasmid) [Streptosporangium sp. NBC_01495]|uniref:hypothetical protein n=1 Tax=Streptosporangium sp. NBC_01495 TaxID=2903899 RepID=UPI002E37116D|nr:hypothetical protein [Streptosporangium sp. NBC_01495]